MYKKLFITCAGLILMFTSLAIGGCSPSEGEGFAIYLTKNDIPADQLEAMSHIEPADEPLISLDDIVSYDASTHEITLKQAAFERVAGLGVPVSGKSFIACVNRSPVYAGAFWTPISSIMFTGMTIMIPLGSENRGIAIRQGYPSDDYYRYPGSDPRNSPEILDSLKQAGKLINEDVSVIPEELPRSMKGYELYSWQGLSRLHFRLITGTNRNKTYLEIVSDPSTTEDWISIKTFDVEGITSLLDKLPEGESVFWMDGKALSDIDENGPEVTIPDQATVDIVKDHAEKVGIELIVP